MSIWSKLKHFNQTENWGNPLKVNGSLLLLLDKIADNVRKYAWQKYKVITPCIIHCAYARSGHCTNSQHYKGNAVDFHFMGISAKEAYEVILQTLKNYQMINFVGLGVYPDWFHKGFHLDVRGYKARWSRINNIYTDIDKGIELLRKV